MKYFAFIFLGVLLIIVVSLVPAIFWLRRKGEQGFVQAVTGSAAYKRISITNSVLHWITAPSVPPAVVIQSVQRAVAALPKPTILTDGYTHALRGEVLFFNFATGVANHAEAVFFPRYSPGQVEYVFFFANWASVDGFVEALPAMQRMREIVHRAVMQAAPHAVYREEFVAHRKPADGYGQAGR